MDATIDDKEIVLCSIQKKFTTPKAKPTPVVLLLDVSLSMSGEKIDNLNKAVEDMLEAFAQEEKMETEILVSVITFGN